MKNLITSIAIIFTILLNAQSISISGKVVSQKENEPLMNVAIAFYDATTQKIITYSYSDFDGNYQANLKNTKFYIQADVLGFYSYKSEIINPLKNLKWDIKMQQNTEQLDEVIVTAKKKFIQLKGDKIIIDVASSGIGDGNNGIETLSKLPGIRLTKDESIAFRGDGNLQILIDGKPAMLSGEALQNYLQTMDGSNIKSVEIIANPSAKYSASGTGGIINIRLKKNKVTGLTGNVASTVGYGEFIKQYNSVKLFKNTKKWNFNAGVFYGYFEGVNHRKIVQTVTQNNQNLVLDQTNDWLPKSNMVTSNLGASYKISKNASIGTSFRFSNDKSDEITNGFTKEITNGNYLNYTLLTKNVANNKRTLTGNMYYSFATDSLTTKVDAQLNYASYQRKQNEFTTNQYLNTSDNLPYQNSVNIQNNNPKAFNIFSAKIDVEHKISDKLSFETGSRFSLVNNDYNLMLKTKNAQGNYVLDTSKSNHLVYNENIFAVYGIVNYSIEKWNFQAGLRSEYIDYNAISKTNNTSNSGNDLSFFPSFSVNKSLDNNQYKFSYSKRIQRPNYLDLNPFYEYIDTYNIQVGNPNLKPQFTDAYDFTWVHKRKTAISLYAKVAKDAIDNVIDYDQTTQITKLYKANVAKTKNIGLSISTSVKATKWWDIYLTGDFSFVHNQSDIPNFSYDETGTNWSVSVNQTLKLKHHWKFTWNSFYNSGGNYGNMVYKPSYDTSLGLKKSFFNKKLQLNVKANNILKQSKWHSITKQDNVKTEWINRWETRKFSLSLRYNFGNGKRKKVKATDLSNEENRL